MKDAQLFLAELSAKKNKQNFDEAAWLAADPFDVPFGDDEALQDASDRFDSLKHEMEQRAVSLLAVREHGDRELKQKLLQKFDVMKSKTAQMFDIKSSELYELVDEVLEICQEKNWQNDERYIEVAVNSLSAKGHGPMKIRQKLLQTTSRSDLISAYLDWGREDWARMAQNVLLKKYGATQPESLQQKAKWARFLQSRGFDFDQINLAMRKEFNE